MSQYGCPESGSRGWTHSVLDMRIEKNKPEKKRQIKLCVKVRNDAELDTESWIPGRYTIFKIGEKCPTGFLFFILFMITNNIHYYMIFSATNTLFYEIGFYQDIFE
jgi:hypothetical protein